MSGPEKKNEKYNKVFKAFSVVVSFLVAIIVFVSSFALLQVGITTKIRSLPPDFLAALISYVGFISLFTGRQLFLAVTELEEEIRS